MICVRLFRWRQAFRTNSIRGERIFCFALTHTRTLLLLLLLLVLPPLSLLLFCSGFALF